MPLPYISTAKAEELFRHRVLCLLMNKELVSEYVYFSRGLGEHRRRREDRQAAWEMVESPVAAGMPPKLKEAIILLFSLLDGQQRRPFGGLEAHKLGLDVHTVARGSRELFGEQVQRQRIRKKGGGRKATEKTREV